MGSFSCVGPDAHNQTNTREKRFPHKRPDIGIGRNKTRMLNASSSFGLVSFPFEGGLVGAGTTPKALLDGALI